MRNIELRDVSFAMHQVRKGNNRRSRSQSRSFHRNQPVADSCHPFRSRAVQMDFNVKSKGIHELHVPLGDISDNYGVRLARNPVTIAVHPTSR